MVTIPAIPSLWQTTRKNVSQERSQSLQHKSSGFQNTDSILTKLWQLTHFQWN